MLHWLGITSVVWEIKNVGWINNNNKLMGWLFENGGLYIKKKMTA